MLQLNTSPGDHNYSYESALSGSVQVAWKIEDLIGGKKQLDFDRPFLPEILVRTDIVSCLNDQEKRWLNQIRGYAYVSYFAMVEEFILPFILDHARSRLTGDDNRTRAILAFANNEAKHIQLFNTFQAVIEKAFPVSFSLAVSAEELRLLVLTHHPLAVCLTILHIEWLSQTHYTESVRDENQMDPVFKEMLKAHWLEEAQHAKLDTLIIETLAKHCTKSEITHAIDEYLGLIRHFDAVLVRQVELDIQTLENISRRQLPNHERKELMAVQTQASRWAFLGAGMTHENFLATVAMLDPKGIEKIEEVSIDFC